MYIAKLSLICLIAFVFMVGCGMMGKKAEMPEAATGSMAGEMMDSEMKTEMMDSETMDSETKDEMMESKMEPMAEDSLEEVTLNVTGMT